MAEASDEDWAAAEFGTAELGDARRRKRLLTLARRLASAPHCSLPQALSRAELKAAYRFFDNEQVDPEGILAPHTAQTIARMRKLPVVLVACDSTEFNLTHLAATTGLGHGSQAHLRGFFMHSQLALAPEGLPLGVVGLKCWARDLAALGQRHRRRSRALAEKESAKWVQGLGQLKRLASHCADTTIVAVCDREADLYELFAEPRAPNVHWLVRAAWDRRVAHPQAHLWAAMAAAPLLGSRELAVPARDKASARRAQLALRAATVRLRRPTRRRAGALPTEVEVHALWAIETDPPAGAEPIEWLLLSSAPIADYDQACERLDWYARRWTIESWHRVLKSGCRIEARQFGSLERFVRATALFAVIAWRILYATWLARLEPALSCEVLLTRPEWQALYCRTHASASPPKRAPTLAEAIAWVARLGGYLGRKHDRPPGPTVLWRGFLALHEITQIYLILRKHE
ncbi:MAG: IS4 family transposase [Pseudomonadota bacterium]